MNAEQRKHLKQRVLAHAGKLSWYNLPDVPEPQSVTNARQLIQKYESTVCSRRDKYESDVSAQRKRTESAILFLDAQSALATVAAFEQLKPPKSKAA